MVRLNKKSPPKSDKTQAIRGQARGVVGYSRKSALLEEAITQMNAGKYGRSSSALKELLAVDPNNMEARRLFATLHLRLGSLIPARQAFDALIAEAFQRQDYWLAESLLREYLAAGPRCVPYLEKLGSLYQEKGDAVEAAVEYGKAIDILIEDPDPEHPQQASQLYAKIRELAPVSPVAFRLASFFDAQTGALLPRAVNRTEESTSPPSPSTPDQGQGSPTSLELAHSVMPWEVQDSPGTAPFSLQAETPHAPLESPSLHRAVDGLELEAQARKVDLLLAESPLQESTKSSPEQAQANAREETESYELKTADPVTETSAHSESVAPVASYSIGTPWDSTTEVAPVTPQETAPVVSSSEPVTVQKVEQCFEHAQQDVPKDGARTSVILPAADPGNAPEVFAGTAQPVEHANGMSSSQVPDVSTPIVSRSDAFTTEPIGTDRGQSPLHQVDEFKIAEPIAENPSSLTSSLTVEQASSNGTAEPWKVAGFSWKSVFDKAWKFEGPPSIDTTQPEQTLRNNSEASTPAPDASFAEQAVLESQSVEIPEREQSAPLADRNASGSAIAPMPWDQVEESNISILPVQTDQPILERVEPVGDQSTDVVEPDSIPAMSQGQPQPSPVLTESPSEEDSFSLVQTPHAEQAPPSTELDVPPSDLSSVALVTECERSSVETEPQSTIASSSAIAEALVPTAPPAAIEPQQVSVDRLVTADVAGGTKGQSEGADLFLKTDDDRADSISQDLGHEPQTAPSVRLSQSAGEMQGVQVDEVQISPSVQPPSKMWEPLPERSEIDQVTQNASAHDIHGSEPHEVALVETNDRISESASQKEDWVRASESIQFVEQPQAAPVEPVQGASSETGTGSQSLSTAASAVEVLFGSSRDIPHPENVEPATEPKRKRHFHSTLARIRIAIAGLISTCFSTTRAIIATLVGLVVLSVLCVAFGIGILALTWVAMEEPPSAAFQNLTTAPQRTLSDTKTNGYLFLLGMDALADHDPIQTGYNRSPDARDGDVALTCFGISGAGVAEGPHASANTVRGWFRSQDPIGQFRSHQEVIKGWGSQYRLALDRYRQWQKLSFEDWGYGQTMNPPCAAIIFAHQLHVADGFVQGIDLGVDRLETDIEAWRIVLSQAKTLPVKMLAVQAINDDIAIASGLLVRSDVDGKSLGRITSFLRPLDQAELSLRWPIQSELVIASKTYETQMKAEDTEEQSIYAKVASMLPLPKQRRLNDYAEYYEASYKAASEGQHGSLPKWKSYVQFPASNVADYLTNPIENVVGLPPLAPWDLYNGFVVDTDARLRLASLQAWLRSGPAESDIVTRIAKAGQRFYDPYTGLPMLVNLNKGMLYSVGHDGKDQDADPQSDVVVEIPGTQTSAAQEKSSPPSAKSR